MDKQDLKADGFEGEGTLQVLEYQGKKGQTMAKRSFNNNLYVKNFSKDPSFTEDDLALLFAEFGKVLNACIMRDENGDSKGFGFVCFEESAGAEKASKAVQESNNALESGEQDGKDISRLANLYVCEAKKKA